MSFTWFTHDLKWSFLVASAACVAEVAKSAINNLICPIHISHLCVTLHFCMYKYSCKFRLLQSCRLALLLSFIKHNKPWKHWWNHQPLGYGPSTLLLCQSATSSKLSQNPFLFGSFVFYQNVGCKSVSAWLTQMTVVTLRAGWLTIWHKPNQIKTWPTWQEPCWRFVISFCASDWNTSVGKICCLVCTVVY